MGSTNGKTINERDLQKMAGWLQPIRRQTSSGLVYCLEEPTKKQLAIKELHVSCKEEVEQLIEMIQAKMRTRHENLVSVVDWFRYRPHTCSDVEKLLVICDYPFKSLKEEIDERAVLKDTFTQQQLWSILYSCVRALQFLKAYKIPYDVLCPQNILISNQGIIKLNDMWLNANDATEVFVSRDQRLMRYLAPELTVSRLEELTVSEAEKANVYSLGMTLFECLEGKPLQKLDMPPSIRNPLVQSMLSQKRSNHFSLLLRKMLSQNMEDRPGFNIILQLIENTSSWSRFFPQSSPQRQKQQTPKAVQKVTKEEKTQQIKSPNKQIVLNPNQIGRKGKPKMRVQGAGMYTISEVKAITRQMSIDKQPRFSHIDPIRTDQLKLTPSLSYPISSIDRAIGSLEPSVELSNKKTVPEIETRDVKVELFPRTIEKTTPFTTENNLTPASQTPRPFQMPQYSPATITSSVARQIFSQNNTIVELDESMNQHSSEHMKQIRLFNEPNQVYRQLENGNIYEGQELRGQPHGYGRMIYSNGSQYIGRWQDGNIEGEGKLFNQRKQLVYEGNWKRNKAHGFGKRHNDKSKILSSPFDYRDFNKIGNFWLFYQGQFKNDLRNGVGLLKLSNGEQYEGQFQQDVPYGDGAYVMSNGEKVKGTWKMGVLQN